MKVVSVTALFSARGPLFSTLVNAVTVHVTNESRYVFMAVPPGGRVERRRDWGLRRGQSFQRLRQRATFLRLRPGRCNDG